MSSASPSHSSSSSSSNFLHAVREFIMGNCLKSSTADDVSLLGAASTIHHSSSTSGPPNPPLGASGGGGGPGDGSGGRDDHNIGGFAPVQDNTPIYYPSPNVSRPASQLTEEEQVKIAQRMGLIQHLPTGSYDGSKKNRECVICMIEFCIGDRVRYLPCVHTYHTECIDDWLMRSFTCPSCMEPVDAALLVTYETH